MKKIILLLCICIIEFGSINAQLQLPGNPTIYTTDSNDVLNTQDINNPIRDGAYKVINAEDSENPDNKVPWLVSGTDKIETHQTAESKTMAIIKNIINYALGLLSFVALVYLIYHGILVMTAAGDDTQYKKWLSGIKYAGIAIGWIWLSRIIISFIFYVIDYITP